MGIIWNSRVTGLTSCNQNKNLMKRTEARMINKSKDSGLSSKLTPLIPQNHEISPLIFHYHLAPTQVTGDFTGKIIDQAIDLHYCPLCFLGFLLIIVRTNSPVSVFDTHLKHKAPRKSLLLKPRLALRRLSRTVQIEWNRKSPLSVPYRLCRNVTRYSGLFYSVH